MARCLADWFAFTSSGPRGGRDINGEENATAAGRTVGGRISPRENLIWGANNSEGRRGANPNMLASGENYIAGGGRRSSRNNSFFFQQSQLQEAHRRAAGAKGNIVVPRGKGINIRDLAEDWESGERLGEWRMGSDAGKNRHFWAAVPRFGSAGREGGGREFLFAAPGRPRRTSFPPTGQQSAAQASAQTPTEEQPAPEASAQSPTENPPAPSSPTVRFFRKESFSALGLRTARCQRVRR